MKLKAIPEKNDIDKEKATVANTILVGYHVSKGFRLSISPPLMKLMKEIKALEKLSAERREQVFDKLCKKIDKEMREK